jgi:ABC-type Fe3+/spermidine/putrescine transport system ATPase subunit
MSDRIAVMSKGAVQQIGTPVEIYERPSNRFVADFIGEANFLDGRIKSLAKDEALVYVPALNADLTGLPVSEGLVNGEEIVVSIRPEKIHITERETLKTNLFRGKVTNTVYIGTYTHVYLDVCGAKLKVYEQNRISRLDPGSFYTVGQEVSLILPPENTLVLRKS